MRSQSGGAISFGRGIILGKTMKQKINTTSSTHAELVGVSDYLPQILWAQKFLEAQGYPIDATFVAQDNQSAMKLEMNGRTSAGPKSRHLDIRYFYITDSIKRDGLTIVHCPTDIMIADFFTKPLQGKLFTKLRNVIMGYTHISELISEKPEHPSTPPNEERVGNVNHEEESRNVELTGSTKVGRISYVEAAMKAKEEEISRKKKK